MEPSLAERAAARHELILRRARSDFLAFAEWWMEEDAIECEPARYVVEVHDVMRRIAERVALETVELYPLVEAVG